MGILRHRYAWTCHMPTAIVPFLFLLYLFFLSFLDLTALLLLECWVTVETQGFHAVALMIPGKVTAQHQGCLCPPLAHAPRVLLSRKLTAAPVPSLESLSCFHKWHSPGTLLGESQGALQCRVYQLFNVKRLTVTMLGRSPGWSVGPAGLRAQNPVGFHGCKWPLLVLSVSEGGFSSRKIRCGQLAQ